MENLKINKNKLSAFKGSFTKSIKNTQGKIKKFLATQTSGNVHPSGIELGEKIEEPENTI